MKINNKQLNILEEKLINYQGQDRMISSIEFKEIISKLPEPKTFHSGFGRLDKLLNGFEEGELVIVSGPTGHGKTTLLLSIMKNMAESGLKTSFFTLENSPRSFIKKFEGGELPLFYLPMKNDEDNINWLMEKIIEGCIKFETKIVFIDHLHQIFSLERLKGNLSLEMGDIVAKLKKLAVEYGLVIFIVAHNVDNKMQINADPTMRDIRDSGMISRLADSVIGVWKINKPDNIEDIFNSKMFNNNDSECLNKARIWKSRREGTWGDIYLVHDNHKFLEMDITQIKTPNQRVDEFAEGLKIKSDEELGFQN